MFLTELYIGYLLTVRIWMETLSAEKKLKEKCPDFQPLDPCIPTSRKRSFTQIPKSLVSSSPLRVWSIWGGGGVCRQNSGSHGNLGGFTTFASLLLMFLGKKSQLLVGDNWPIDVFRYSCNSIYRSPFYRKTCYSGQLLVTFI